MALHVGSSCTCTDSPLAVEVPVDEPVAVAVAVAVRLTVAVDDPVDEAVAEAVADDVADAAAKEGEQKTVFRKKMQRSRHHTGSAARREAYSLRVPVDDGVRVDVVLEETVEVAEPVTGPREWLRLLRSRGIALTGGRGSPGRRSGSRRGCRARRGRAGRCRTG